MRENTPTSHRFRRTLLAALAVSVTLASLGFLPLSGTQAGTSAARADAESIQPNEAPKSADTAEALVAEVAAIVREDFYVHVWSYAGLEVHQLLESLVQSGGELASADALVFAPSIPSGASRWCCSWTSARAAARSR